MRLSGWGDDAEAGESAETELTQTDDPTAGAAFLSFSSILPASFVRPRMLEVLGLALVSGAQSALREPARLTRALLPACSY